MNDELQTLLQMAMQTTAPVSTQVMPEYAHDSIDTEIGRDNLLTMSQMPERQLVGGVGTGLDALAGFSKAASLIPAGSKRMMDLISEIMIKRGLTKSARKSSQKFVDAAKKGGVDYDNLISKYSKKADELRSEEGALQLSEEWLKLFGTRRAKNLMETEERLIDFLK